MSPVDGPAKDRLLFILCTEGPLRWVSEMMAFGDLISRRRPGVEVSVAAVAEYDTPVPTLAHLARVLRPRFASAVVLPMALADAAHLPGEYAESVRQAASSSGMSLTLADPLGEGDTTALVAALQKAAALQGLRVGDPIVIATDDGDEDPTEREFITELAARWSAVRSAPVHAAAIKSGSSTNEVMRRVAKDHSGFGLADLMPAHTRHLAAMQAESASREFGCTVRTMTSAGPLADRACHRYDRAAGK